MCNHSTHLVAKGTNPPHSSFGRSTWATDRIARFMPPFSPKMKQSSIAQWNIFVGLVVWVLAGSSAWFQSFENEKFWGGGGGSFCNWQRKRSLDPAVPAPTTAPQLSSKPQPFFYRCDYFRFRRCSDGCLKVRLQTKRMHL